MTRPRPLTPIQLTELAGNLTELAQILTRPDATDIVERVVVAATIGYPKSGFAGGTSGGGQGNGTPLDATDDRIAGFAGRLLKELHQLRIDSRVLASSLRGWAADRPVTADPRCGHALAPGEDRCRLIAADGTPCGTEVVVPTCADCEKPIPAGERRKGRCNACRVFLERHGYTKASVATYAVAAKGIIVDGVAHA